MSDINANLQVLEVPRGDSTLFAAQASVAMFAFDADSAHRQLRLCENELDQAMLALDDAQMVSQDVMQFEFRI